MNILKILICCMLAANIFTSCASNQTENRSDGVLVDRNVLSSIIKDIEDKENSYLAEDGNVFWTASGQIWHASHECSYLANSKEILHGTVDEALLAGKERACTRCFTTDEDKAYAELEGKDIENGDVFFSREGNKWHTNINCSKLIGVEKIYNSSVEKALELGKTGACEECE